MTYQAEHKKEKNQNPGEENQHNWVWSQKTKCPVDSNQYYDNAENQEWETRVRGHNNGICDAIKRQTSNSIQPETKQKEPETDKQSVDEEKQVTIGDSEPVVSVRSCVTSASLKGHLGRVD